MALWRCEEQHAEAAGVPEPILVPVAALTVRYRTLIGMCRDAMTPEPPSVATFVVSGWLAFLAGSQPALDKPPPAR